MEAFERGHMCPLSLIGFEEDGMGVDALLRLITGCDEDVPPWALVEQGDTVVFRWGDIEARWQRLDEETLEAWLKVEAPVLQQLYAQHLQTRWGETLEAAVRERLLSAGMPLAIVEQVRVMFDVSTDWPLPGEMAAWEARLPEGRAFVEVVSDAFDMEPVGTFWLGHAEIATMADELAGALVEVWRKTSGET